MLLAQTDALISEAGSYAERFGFSAFLLTAILFALAFALWRLGGRLTDGLIIAISSMADSGKKTSEVTQGIKNVLDVMTIHNGSIDEQLKIISSQNIITGTHQAKIVNTQLALISILIQVIPDTSVQVKQSLNQIYEDLKKQSRE